MYVEIGASKEEVQYEVWLLGNSKTKSTRGVTADMYISLTLISQLTNYKVTSHQ